VARWSYQSAASMISVWASGCTTSCTAVPKLAHDGVASCFPRDSGDGPAPHVMCSLVEFFQPRSVDVVIRRRLETFKQAMSELGTLIDGKSEHFGQEGLSGRHARKVARTDASEKRRESKAARGWRRARRSDGRDHARWGPAPQRRASSAPSRWFVGVARTGMVPET
jgi:hypothetical protein